MFIKVTKTSGKRITINLFNVFAYYEGDEGKSVIDFISGYSLLVKENEQQIDLLIQTQTVKNNLMGRMM